MSRLQWDIAKFRYKHYPDQDEVFTFDTSLLCGLIRNTLYRASHRFGSRLSRTNSDFKLSRNDFIAIQLHNGHVPVTKTSKRFFVPCLSMSVHYVGNYHKCDLSRLTTLFLALPHKVVRTSNCAQFILLHRRVRFSSKETELGNVKYEGNKPIVHFGFHCVPYVKDYANWLRH